MLTHAARSLAIALLGIAIPSGAATPTGPAVGGTIPEFSAPDQNGQLQSLKTISGPKGAMLVFFRSADW